MIPLYLRKQLFLAGCAYIGQIFCGYNGGWSTSAVIKLQDPEQTPLDEVLDDWDAYLLGPLPFIGLICSSVAGYLSNAKGRRPCLMIGGIIGIISFFLTALALNKPMIFVGRVMTGMSTGMIFVINLVYLAEISSTNIRGILLVGTGVTNSLGMLVAYVVGPYASYAVTAYFGFALAIIFTVLTYFMPETPYFHLLNGEEDKVKASLEALGREDDIKDILDMKADEPVGVLEAWSEIFSVKSNRKAIFIVLSLMLFQQMSGWMIVIMFATSIFDLVNSAIESHVSTIIIGVTLVVASSITPLIIERIGRKIIMLTTALVSALCLAALGLYFYLDHINHSATDSLQWLPLVSLICFILFYNCGFGVIPGTLSGELFDSRVRGPGSVLCVTISWIAGLMISFFYSTMINNLGSYTTFWFYSVVCACAFIFTVLFVPETKGKSFIEIQHMLSR